MPSTSGIRKSVMTTSNSRPFKVASASLPPGAASTRWPARRRWMARNSRMERSSSTIRMSPVGWAMGLLPLACNQDEKTTQVAQTGPIANRAFGSLEQRGQRRDAEDL